MPVIYLIRHGQASFGAENYDQLSELGVRQSRHLGEHLQERQLQPDQVICGSMRRHQQTAEHCLQTMGVESTWRQDPGWNEYDHQQLLEAYAADSAVAQQLVEDMGGSDPQRAFQQHFEQAVGRWSSGQYDSDYRESWSQFCSRVEDALQRVAEQAQGTVFVFSSGGAIAAACRRLLQLPDDSTLQLNWVMANAGLSKCLLGRKGLQLSSLNDHSHFEGCHRELLSYR